MLDDPAVVEAGLEVTTRSRCPTDVNWGESGGDIGERAFLDIPTVAKRSR